MPFYRGVWRAEPRAASIFLPEGNRGRGRRRPGRGEVAGCCPQPCPGLRGSSTCPGSRQGGPGEPRGPQLSAQPRGARPPPRRGTKGPGRLRLPAAGDAAPSPARLPRALPSLKQTRAGSSEPRRAAGRRRPYLAGCWCGASRAEPSRAGQGRAGGESRLAAASGRRARRGCRHVSDVGTTWGPRPAHAYRALWSRGSRPKAA